VGPKVIAAGAAAVLLLGAGWPAVGAPAPVSGERRIPVNSCWPSDNTNPSLNQLTLSSGSIDVTAEAKTLTVRALISDSGGPGPASGVSGATVTLSPPAAGDPISIRMDPAKKKFHWVGRLTLPRGSVDGAWRVTTVFLSDKAFNTTSYSYDDLAAAPFDRDLTVVAVPDATGPTVSALHIDPRTVDARKHDARATFTGVANDTGGAGLRSVTAVVTDGTNTLGAILTKVPGKPGKVRGTLSIARWTGNQTWTLVQVIADDKGGNRTTYDSGFGALGFDRSFRVRSKEDRKEPTVSGAHLSTHRVDIRKHAETLEVRLVARDPASGVGSATVTVDTPGSFFGRTRTLRRGPGGVYRGTIRMTSCNTPTGKALVSVEVSDAAGNGTALQLGKVTVRAKDRVVPTATVVDSSAVPTTLVTVDFDEPVTGISTASAVVLPISSLASVAGSWTCVDDASAAVSCETGAVSQARFAPFVALNSGAFYSLLLNPEGTLDVTDLHGNPFHRNQVVFKAV
jgi:hypothetical protein